MASLPQVTVLLTHYRCERFLAEAIASILGQEGVDLRLLLVDDASPDDGWLAVARELAGDPRLAVYQSTVNVGHYRLKNRLLAEVRSPFVALQDADDVSEPRRLSRQIAEMERTGAHVLGCGFAYIAEDGEVLGERRMVRRCGLWLRLGKRFVSLHPTTVVRREVFDALVGYDGTARFAADDDFILRAVRLFRVRNLPEVLYRYRQRPDSLTGSPDTGHGSAAREAYRRGMLERVAQRRRLRGRDALLASLKAPPNDVEFELRRIDLGA